MYKKETSQTAEIKPSTQLSSYPLLFKLTRSYFGLITHDPHRAAVHSGKSHHNVFRVVGHDLKEVPLIHDLNRCVGMLLRLFA